MPIFAIIDYNAITAIKLGCAMTTSITVRNLEADIKTRLRLLAAQHGWSMEQEVRHILQQATRQEATPATSLAQRIHNRFAPMEVDDLPLPERHPVRTAPQFD
jgi:plasmid stability protein